MAERRYFTLEEANDLLPAVKSLAERMVGHRHALASAQQRHAGFVTRIAGNGGGLNPADWARVQDDVEQQAAGVAHCVEAIHELGALVKDVDEGLVDFPSRREGTEVLLCWRLGEDEIRHWHGVDEGFAGRKPL